MCHRQVKRPSGDVYLNTCHNLFFLGRIQTPVFSDRPFFFLRVYVSRTVEQAFRRCLFEYMYNPPRVILDSRLQGTAHESEEIELQGEMMMIAFITIKSSLVPLIEGLCAQIYFDDMVPHQ